MYENSSKNKVQENVETLCFCFAAQFRKYTVATHCNPGDQRMMCLHKNKSSIL